MTDATQLNRGELAPSASSKASYKTVRPAPQRQHSKRFRTRIILLGALVAAVTALVMTIVLGVVWEGRFQTYTRDNMERLAQSTASTLSQQYIAQGGWNEDVLEYASAASTASTEIAVQVIDQSGHVLYDDTWAHSVRNQRKPQLATLPTSADSDEAVIVVPIAGESGEEVGVLRLWALGSDALLTKSDARFRSESYTAILMAAVVAVILSLVFGSVASNSLSKPIRAIIATARQIRNGDLTARTNLIGDDEIGRLGEVFDSMAATLERDIKFEHRLTSDVAHELRTPLMAMQATVEAMQDGVLPADEERLETVASEVRRLSRLVDAMLHLSRIENGKREVKLERTDVVYMVKNLVSVQNQIFHEKGLHLRFEDKTPYHECYADIDPDLITEAVANLMSNAMRYTPEGGWVLVSVQADKRDVLIAVQDTGVGIAEEDLSRVFARFWRSESSRETVSGGLGVGLAITKEIIDQHNGKIHVESELGKGTTFTLRIPSSVKTA